MPVVYLSTLGVALGPLRRAAHRASLAVSPLRASIADASKILNACFPCPLSLTH
ncbi:hypothetical protein [Escherichia coli]|uniref:hypothetical protein n=1 Tax=Escherichia coli TaxID=562 RepID=UPI00388EF046